MRSIEGGVGRPDRRPPAVVLALVVAWIQVVGTFFAAQHAEPRRPYDLGAALLLGLSPIALAWRRKHPVPVLFASVAATGLYWNLGYPEGPVFVAEAIALVVAIVRGRRVAALAAVVTGYTLAILIPWAFDTRPTPSPTAVVGALAWTLALFAGAEFFRTRREAALEAMRSRGEERRRRASEERMEIARELHDVLAHNISLINVQANVGLHLMEDEPDQARSSLAAIKEVSAETLAELRSVLDVLRGDGSEAPRSPTSGLAHLDDLLARTRAAGLEVAKRIEGEPRALPPEVDLAAFRIVQESLTNVRRHSGSPRANVTLTYSEDALSIRVEDAGRGGSVPADTEGRGIAGMRERARAVGGNLTASPIPGGGFRVNAVLPITGARR